MVFPLQEPVYLWCSLARASISMVFPLHEPVYLWLPLQEPVYLWCSLARASISMVFPCIASISGFPCKSQYIYGVPLHSYIWCSLCMSQYIYGVPFASQYIHRYMVFPLQRASISMVFPCKSQYIYGVPFA